MPKLMTAGLCFSMILNIADQRDEKEGITVTPMVWDAGPISSLENAIEEKDWFKGIVLSQHGWNVMVVKN